MKFKINAYSSRCGHDNLHNISIYPRKSIEIKSRRNFTDSMPMHIILNDVKTHVAIRPVSIK